LSAIKINPVRKNLFGFLKIKKKVKSA